LSWRLLSQCFMRSQMIVLLHKAINGLLLFSRIRRRRLGYSLLKASMHTFVPSILLRVAWGNAFRDNPQECPPYGKSRKTSQGPTGKRHPVICANSPRKPVFPEYLLKDITNLSHRRLDHCLAAQKIPTRTIQNRQRIYTLTIPCSKPPLEIRTPNVIRFTDMLKWLCVWRCTTTSFPFTAQPMPFQDLSHGALHRPVFFRFRSLQPRQKFLRSPEWVLVAQCYDGVLDLLRNLVRMIVRFPASLYQAGEALCPPSIEPFTTLATI